MSGFDSIGQDELDDGTLVRRRRRTQGTGDGAPESVAADPGVDDPGAAVESTVVLERASPLDRTDPAEDLENTVVVQRSGIADEDALESTVLLDRTTQPPDEPVDPVDQTVVRERTDAGAPEALEEQTVIGGRRARRIDAEAAAVLEQDVLEQDVLEQDVLEQDVLEADEPEAPSVLPIAPVDEVRAFEAPLRSFPPARPRSHRAKRTRIILPPSTEASTRAQVGVGPGAVAPYAPREVPPPPPPPMELAEGPDASRADAPQMPSVRRASARSSAIVLASVVGACAVSVTGLTLIAITLFGG